MIGLRATTTSHIRWASAGAIATAVALGVAQLIVRLGAPPAHESATVDPATVAAPRPPGDRVDHSEHASGDSPPKTRAPVHVAADRAAMLGLVVEPVTESDLDQSIRAVAVVVPDESRLTHVHARFAGFVERLYVSTTGASVRRGQPVADIFSRELLAAQGEYLVLLRLGARGKSDALDAARARLDVLGMGKGGVASLERRGKPHRSVTVVSPRSGVVLRRNVTAGTAVDAGTEIVTIADLSRVWVLAEIPEAAMGEVDVGDSARIELPSSGLPPLEAKVAFVYPTLSEQTRTLRIRFEIDNVDGRVRPGIYGTAELQQGRKAVLTVAREAVVDTGAEQHVFVMTEEGQYVPRKVVLGAHARGRVEVREGLAEGEHVVSSGVFLLDSESRLRASGAGSGHGSH